MYPPPVVSSPSDRSVLPPAGAGVRAERVVGDVGDPAAGPTVVFVAGIHGNEPAGVLALQRVFARLDPARVHGRVVGLAGNLAALAAGRRYLDEDLNRIWSAERIRALESGRVPATAEAGQQRRLLSALREILAAAREVRFLDLHTSSAPGGPFVCIGDTLRNRRFAMGFPVPVVLGLEEQVDGALLEYVNNLGHVTVGVEGGQHEDPEAVALHEAFAWLALRNAGSLQAPDRRFLQACADRLARAARSVPAVLEVRHRHPVRPQDGFRMRPGYRSFQPVRRGEILALDRHGEVRAPEDGRILLPLYQGQGSDGFFLVREFSRRWLRLSALLRRCGGPRLVGWLPGVRRRPGSDEIEVDPRVARWYAVELLHLLGFRKRRSAAGKLLFVRRRERPPERC